MQGVRIDTRPRGDEAVAAGIRNIHRDTAGNVIGGITAEGQGIGTKSSKFRGSGGGGSLTPRLDAGPKTPGLDKWHAANDNPVVRPTFAQQDAAAREASAASGAFGKQSQNLAGRRSLFRDMQAAGRGGITPAMESTAGKLGVKRSRFRDVAASIQPAPAAVAVSRPPMRMGQTSPAASVQPAQPPKNSEALIAKYQARY